jgi:polyphosphate glucokinase
MAKTVSKLVASDDYDGPIGCCFPAVIQKGRARTAGNIDDDWLETHVADTFADATGHEFFVLNDADAAAVAEMRLGAGVDLQGLVLTLTIGTGIGSGMFHNGRLVPNLEIGWMPSGKGLPMERYAGDRARKVNDLSWDEWGKRFNYFLKKTHRVFMPDHYILGGGASKKFDKFEHRIKIETPIHIAHFRNNSGIIGAAIEASEEMS